MKEFFNKLFNLLVHDDSEYEEMKRKASRYDKIKSEQKEQERKQAIENLVAGARVKIKQTAGFSRGAIGIIKYVEPHGQRVWVLRDGASTDAYFHPKELELIV